MFELVLGGAASGKSEFAEAEAQRLGTPHYYLATMQREHDAGLARIEKHVKRREGTDFITVECARDISSVSGRVKGGTVLLECVTNLAANELFDGTDTVPLNGQRHERLLKKICADIVSVAYAAGNLIAVSGDVFRDGVTYGVETEAYIKLLAVINRCLAERADRVYEIIYSCPKRIK